MVFWGDDVFDVDRLSDSEAIEDTVVVTETRLETDEVRLGVTDALEEIDSCELMLRLGDRELENDALITCVMLSVTEADSEDDTVRESLEAREAVTLAVAIDETV